MSTALRYVGDFSFISNTGWRDQVPRESDRAENFPVGIILQKWDDSITCNPA